MITLTTLVFFQLSLSTLIFLNLRALGAQIGTLMALIDDLITDVQDESTVDDSIIALLTSISAQLASAGTDQTKLAQLKTMIDANKAKISAAVVANTPAVPPTA